MPGKLIVDEIEDSGGTSVIGRKNYIINGNFDIWQRGTSFTSSGYHADRWSSVISGTGTTTISQQTFTLGQTDVPNNPKYHLRYAKSSGATTGDFISTKLENVRNFSGETVTLSFWAKASAATTLSPSFRQYFGSGGSPSSLVQYDKADLSVTTSWQKFTINNTFTSISGKTLGTDGADHIEFFFEIKNGANDSLDVAQFQLEKGSVATDFEIRPIGEEIHLCKRYYQIISGASLYSCGIQKNITDNQYKVVSPVVLPVELRGLDGTVTIPSSTTNFSWQEAANSRTSIGDINTNNGQLFIYTSWTGTSLDAHLINVGGDIEIDAEL
jgi:hypothetical protein